MKIWVDDVRMVPDGHIWCRSVNDAMVIIRYLEQKVTELRGMRNVLKAAGASEDEIKKWENYIEEENIELIDIDHDAGIYANDGGDYIKLLDWLEETGRNYPIRIHSMNPVGVENMRRVIQRNGWTEVE